MKLSSRVALSVMVAALFPTLAGAQNTAGIAGVVRDASGSVLPGVTVEAASPVLIEKVRSVVTDDTGQYRVVDLRPGTYSVTFSLPGFSTVRREGLTLSAGITLPINAELAVGAVQETLTVSGTTPVVDVQNTRRQDVIGREMLEALPRASNVVHMASLMPGMVVVVVKLTVLLSAAMPRMLPPRVPLPCRTRSARFKVTSKLATRKPKLPLLLNVMLPPTPLALIVMLAKLSASMPLMPLLE